MSEKMVVWMSAEHGTCELPEGERPAWAPAPPVAAPPESAKKAAWLEHASNLGIPGCDTMTKEELIAAVREQEQ